MLIPSPLHGRVEQNNVFELLRYRGYDMKLGISLIDILDWLIWVLCVIVAPYSLDEGLASCVQSSLEQVRKLRNDSTVLANRKLRDVPDIFFEGESTYPSGWYRTCINSYWLGMLPVLRYLRQQIWRKWCISHVCRWPRKISWLDFGQFDGACILR